MSIRLHLFQYHRFYISVAAAAAAAAAWFNTIKKSI
jgi:hypothetical protein